MVAAYCAKDSCLSRNSCFQGLVSLWTLLLPSKEGKYHWITVITVMQNTGHPGKYLGTHSRLYLSMVLMLFQAREHPWCILCTHAHPCDVITVGTMPPSGRAHPHACTIQVWSKLGQRFLRYWHFYILPPIFPILTIISTWSPAPETWPQIQCHNNLSPSLPRPLQMLLPVCWQLWQHQ